MRWQERPDVIGDLVTPSDFLFTVECKKHAKIDLGVLLQPREPNTTDDILNWWAQACDEATRAGRQPLLVFEWDRGYPVAMLPYGALAELVIHRNAEDGPGVLHTQVLGCSHVLSWPSLLRLDALLALTDRREWFTSTKR
jgi:hypothetical protein